MNRTPFSYRLAFVDLDDTLLGPRKDISPANLRALGRLRDAGVEIAIASGRHHQNITRLPQLETPGWVLSSHGSIVRHEQTGETLASVLLAPESVAPICARADELGFCVVAYHGDDAYLERQSEWTDLYAREAGWMPKETAFASLDPYRFQKLIWCGPPDRVAEVAPLLYAEFSDEVNVLVTNPELLEFFPRTVNKAVGAQALASKLQVAVGETLAFGDGSNDVEILGWAGSSVAMDHGRDIARRAARFVSPAGPPEDAFARAVDLIFRSEEENHSSPPVRRGPLFRGELRTAALPRDRPE